MTDKLIVTHGGALRRKYGAGGWRRIGAAVRRLVAADRRRGLATRLVLLDDALAMRARRGTPLADPGDYPAAKAAIDAAYRAESPDYLMILGAPDVVPHQPLVNPLHDPPDEPDRYAWSDLPYACEGRCDDDIASFTGPTRVVGRLPDLRGATSAAEAGYLVGLLDTAAGYRSRAADDYAAHFALSAKTWTVSSGRNLFAIFGRRDALRTSPPSGPRFGDAALRALAHFINCHGGEGSPEFQGQAGKRYPIALTTRSIHGRIAPGTVAAVECCYGAQLYAAGLIGVDIPICQSYLEQGAYGYFGSTTIAYGESRANAAADLMVQYFLLEALDGASLGRAALRARQRYVREIVDLDPTDLKTLAQFTLLGDPAIHPVRSAEPHAARGAKRAGTTGAARRDRRRERRARLVTEGRFLQSTRATASVVAKKRALPRKLERTLRAIAKDAGIKPTRPFREFAVHAPRPADARAAPGTKRGAAKARRPVRTAFGGRRYFVAIQKPRGAPGGPRAVAVVVKQVGERIVDVRTYEQR
ncbi:hypothetical protein BURK1_03342 [Burkholderiales bacterium]|nr:hypothetical protein BURK1_03342 [Burkholderiales bacterium]